MSKETIGECGCCGFEGVLVKSYPRRQGETILLCKLCAGTLSATIRYTLAARPATMISPRPLPILAMRSSRRSRKEVSSMKVYIQMQKAADHALLMKGTRLFTGILAVYPGSNPKLDVSLISADGSRTTLAMSLDEAVQLQAAIYKAIQMHPLDEFGGTMTELFPDDGDEGVSP